MSVNVSGTWDENYNFVPGNAVTHTEHDPKVGPLICKECSQAIQDWVRWPCQHVILTLGL